MDDRQLVPHHMQSEASAPLIAIIKDNIVAKTTLAVTWHLLVLKQCRQEIQYVIIILFMATRLLTYFLHNATLCLDNCLGLTLRWDHSREHILRVKYTFLTLWKDATFAEQ